LAEPTIYFHNLSSGSSSAGANRSLDFSGADAVLLCFDVDDRVSFDNVRDRWLPEVQKSCPGIPTTLVGLRSEGNSSGPDTRKIKVEITPKEAQKLVRKLGSQAYVDYSMGDEKGPMLLKLTEQVSETKSPFRGHDLAG
jgi:Rho family protein